MSAVGSTATRRRVLVTGGAGNVAGWMARTVPGDVELHVTEHRAPVPDDVRAVAAVHRVDLRRGEEALRRVVGVRPDLVVHCAYSQSDRDSIVGAAQHVAGAARQVGAALVHLSTDVVFAGDSPPYDEDATTDPITDYGRWKAEAEERVRMVLSDVCITRTSLVVSLDPLDPATAGFAAAVGAGDDVALFTDELRQPIRAEDLAEELWGLVRLGRDERSGVWHLPGPERLSRHELGLRLAARLGLDRSRLRAASSAQHPTPRPRDTELSSVRRSRLGVRLRPVDT